MTRRTQRCFGCGAEINAKLSTCTECGASLSSGSGGRKSAGVAFALSFLITGLGQAYLGKFARGAGWFFGGILLAVFLASAHLGPLALFVPLAAAFDAYAQTKTVNGV